MESLKRNYAAMAAIAAVVIIAVFGGIALSRNLGKSQKAITKEAATAKLNKYVKKIAPDELDPIKGTITYTGEDTTYQELPNVSDDSIAVDATTSLYAEIFSSSEKTGTGTDGYLRDMVSQFNSSGTTIDGTKVSIKLRTISSGQQVDYVASGKYVPDAISPSSDLSVKMLNEKGVETEYASESLVTNYAGIVLSKATYSTLVEDYGQATVQTVAQATIDGKITMGYTNPFTSATGMNFLVTLLDSHDPGNILSTSSAEYFSSFQKNIPFVALTTGQMRNAADKGTFDAFVLEYQTFVNDSALSKNYMFIPFGFKHTNPLATISSTDDTKKEILNLFVDYCEKNGSSLASADGFNQTVDSFVAPSIEYTGAELISAQQLYKENKDSKPVICVFVADISGSMAGDPIIALKNSLVNSMQYINEDNYIGLVTYNDNVYINLPINKFDLDQQSYFVGTVDSLDASGGTATFDALCVAMDMILDKQKDEPDTKAMIFVLSDGMSNRGYNLNQVKDIVTGLQIPVYTIGYNADIDALKELSDINEGVCIDASTDDVTYQLKQLFNASM